MTSPKTIAIAGVCTLLTLVVFDIAGVLACLFFEIFAESSSSGALFYAIWFVDGVFCGLVSYNLAGGYISPDSKKEWTRGPRGRKTSWIVVLTTAAVLVILGIACYLLQWRHELASSYYVPDSEPASLVFFFTVLASVLFVHKTMTEKPKRKTSH